MSGRAALYTTEAITEPMFGRRDYEIHRTAFVRADREEQAPRVHPDAELLRLGAELDAVWKKERAAWDSIDQSNQDDIDAKRGLAEQHYKEASSVVSQIWQLPATTLEGLRTKAMAVAWCHGSDEVKLCSGDSHSDLGFADAIVKDLLAIPLDGSSITEPAHGGILPKPERTLEVATIQDALESAHDLAGMMYALSAIFDEVDLKTPRDDACAVLIRKAQELAAVLPNLIDEAHHTALFAEMARATKGQLQKAV